MIRCNFSSSFWFTEMCGGTGEEEVEGGGDKVLKVSRRRVIAEDNVLVVKSGGDSGNRSRRVIGVGCGRIVKATETSQKWKNSQRLLHYWGLQLHRSVQRRRFEPR
jgi:hypothetical protein